MVLYKEADVSGSAVNDGLNRRLADELADGGLRLNTPLAPALRLGADRVLVVALRQSPEHARDAQLADQRVENYASPVFLFGKVLNALLLDPLDTDLARMHVMNEILSQGEKVYGAEFVDKINAAAHRERGQAFRLRPGITCIQAASFRSLRRDSVSVARNSASTAAVYEPHQKDREAAPTC